MRNQWSRLLGEVATPKQPAVHEGAPPIERQAGLIIRREILETEPGVLVPLMTVALEVEESKSSARRPMTIAVADDGIAGILRRLR